MTLKVVIIFLIQDRTVSRDRSAYERTEGEGASGTTAGKTRISSRGPSLSPVRSLRPSTRLDLRHSGAPRCAQGRGHSAMAPCWVPLVQATDTTMTRGSQQPSELRRPDHSTGAAPEATPDESGGARSFATFLARRRL